MMIFVQRKRDISRNACNSPCCHLFALFSVQDTELAGAGKRHIDLWIRFVEFDAAWTRIRFDVPDMCARPRVDDREGPRFCIAGTNVKVFRCWIVAYMVRVVANGEAVDWFECVPGEDFAVPSVPLATNNFLKSAE